MVEIQFRLYFTSNDYNNEDIKNRLEDIRDKMYYRDDIQSSFEIIDVEPSNAWDDIEYKINCFLALDERQYQGIEFDYDMPIKQIIRDYIQHHLENENLRYSYMDHFEATLHPFYNNYEFDGHNRVRAGATSGHTYDSWGDDPWEDTSSAEIWKKEETWKKEGDTEKEESRPYQEKVGNKRKIFILNNEEEEDE
jgi:hypothetical protein